MYFNRFQPFLFILKLFQWFHAWNHWKRSENEKKNYTTNILYLLNINQSSRGGLVVKASFWGFLWTSTEGYDRIPQRIIIDGLDALSKPLTKLFEYNVVEFCMLNFNQVITSRQTNFITLKNNRTKVGINSLSNRLHVINNLIPLEWLNLSIGSFKVNCKKLLLN